MNRLNYVPIINLPGVKRFYKRLKYPEIPLLTIHDSIVSKEEYIGIVEHELKIHLKNYFGIMPELKPEPWCKDCEEAA